MAKRLLGSLAALFLGLGACAHQQAKPVTTETVEPPVARAPSLAPTPTPARDDGLADLEAMLRGAVVRFEFDKADLSSASEGRLQKIADALKSHPGITIKVAGNCDERGTEEYNLLLGQKRAEAVKKYLADLGVDTSRIETTSYGKEKPVDSAHNEQAWAANRRDDLAPESRM